jgi:hypothetical protein
MGINAFEIGQLNINVLGPSGNQFGASFASEFPLAFDNINAAGSRMTKLMGVYSNVDSVDCAPGSADSYGQPTGNGNPCGAAVRPNGGYYTRALWYSGTAFYPNPNRNGYVGSFCSGVCWDTQQSPADYAFDINSSGSEEPATVDYEPIYTHGQANFPQSATPATQWRDAANPPVDGSTTITNSSSAYSRTPYMPPSTFLFHIDSAGSNTLGSGDVKFHFENRPSLRAAGYNDGNQNAYSGGSSQAGSCVNGGTPGPYSSDPLYDSYSPQIVSGGQGNNRYEYYQVSGVRKLNSRGLSLHLAKVFDNSWNAYGYIYEEDAITTGPNAFAQGNHYLDYSVNCQTEYTWQRDKAARITAVQADGAGNTTITAANTFTIGQKVLIQGLNVATWVNGYYLTVTSLIGIGPNYTGFVGTGVAHAAYGPSNECWSGTQGSYGYAVYEPDFRTRQNATFVINEEYYGFVMDTKCTIWSNKSSMIPLLFFDLADVWTGSTAPRIAGVAVVPTWFSYTSGVNPNQTLGYQVLFLAEDGSLARYDFTQQNGVLELAGVGSFSFASSAPAPVAAGEAYGAMKARNTLSPITATAVTGTTTLTVTAANTLAVGDIVNITGTAEAAINNTTVSVATLIGTAPNYTGFTATIPATTNYSNPADTGTASGYSVWALYGTMVADPRTTQTGLANPANINLFRYNITAGTWSGPIASGLTGRHNGRSLNEMIVKRDGRVYIMCEDVTSAGGTVANAFGAIGGQMYNINWQIMCYDPPTAAWNTSKVNGSTGQPLQYGTSSVVDTSGTTVTWVSGDLFGQVGTNGQPVVINGVVYTMSSWSGPTQVNLTTSAGTQTGVSYSYANMGAHASAPLQGNSGGGDYWFYNINCSMHDVAPDVLLVQPNWTAGTLQTLNTTSAPALTNSNLATVPTYYNVSLQPSTILPSPGPNNYLPGQADPTVAPVDIVHNRDYANGAGDRTILVVGNFIFLSNGANNNGGPWIPLYYAPPSYNWLSPTPLPFMLPNYYSSHNIQQWQKDCWSYDNITSGGNAFDHTMWNFPTIVEDNYIHFVRGSGSADGYQDTNQSQSGTSYGRAAYQTIGYLPTYWKWTGSAWVIADSWTDAANNPYTVPAANTNVPLPYGLQVQFGPAAGNSLTGGEFDTFNLCYGNTKYTRKGRFSWAMFAGQTFVNTDTRTVATQNAMSVNFVDTDIWQTPTYTAPTSATPQTATVVGPGGSVGSYPNSWNTQALWPKLDTTNTPFDATPITMTFSVGSAGGFNPNTWINPPAYEAAGNENDGSQNLTPPGVNPWTWTVGANTYVSSESWRSSLGYNPSWYAWAGNPQLYWQGTSYPCFNQIDLGVGNPQSCLSYGFRPAYDNGDNLFNSSQPVSYQLQASANGTFTDNGGGPFVVDDRTGANQLTSWKRGMAFNCNGPAAGNPYRYYRWYAVSGNGGGPSVGMIRMNSQVMTSSVNFSELAFFGYGSQTNNTYGYNFLRNWQWARGLTIQVSTNSGVSYTTILEPATTGNPTGIQALWRSHTGNVFTFPRQVGVTNIKVTCQSGYNLGTQPNGSNVPLTAGFGPFYLFDYDPQDLTGQAALNAARLGSSLAPVGTVDAASWDPQCIGMSKDTASLSFDGSSPNAITEYGPATNINGAGVNYYAATLFSFWDFFPATGSIGAGTATYKMHPFFGFCLLPGAGADAGLSNVTGYTNMAITYQWGRRV